MSRDPRERYMLYVRGFRDGAYTTAMRHQDEPDYTEGYSDGITARHAALDEFCKRIGYVPTVLRLQDGEP